MPDRQYWRDFVSEKIEAGVVTAALAAITRGWSLISKWPFKWIAERLMEELWDKTGDRVVRFFMRKGWLAVDMASGAIKVKQINKAKDENNSDDYWRTIGGVLLPYA